MRYPYRCTVNREHSMEREHPVGTAPDVEPCEHCGAQARRVFSRPLIVVRNGGYDNRGNRAKDTVR